MSWIDRVSWLIAMLLNSGGLRLLDTLRSRGKDLDVELGELTIREGTGTRTGSRYCPGR